MEPTIAPVKNAKYKAVIILGNPKTIPIKNASFTSPKPMPLPFVTTYKARKKRKAPTPENILLMIDD